MASRDQTAIYCRLSHAPDGSLEKVERQESDCRAVIRRLRWPEPTEEHIYRDNSRSAWQRNRRRPAWDQMVAAIGRDEIGRIVVYHGDRLLRQPEDLEVLLRLAEQRGLLLASVSGQRDLTDPDDQFVLRIEAAQACRSSADTSRRVARGWQARAAKGLPGSGGRRPFGFEPDRTTVRESEAELLREAASRLLTGQTQAGVVAWLRTRSTGTTGRPWAAKTLHNLLTSPRIVGLVHSRGNHYPAAWDPIISREDQAEIEAIYAESARLRPYSGRRRVHLLSGIAECGHCGAALKMKPVGRSGKSSRIYYCRACSRTARNMTHLDEYVTGRVLGLLNEKGFLDELAEATDPKDGNGIGKKIVDLERRHDRAKQQLAELADHPELSPALIADSLESYTTRIGELRAQQATTTRARLLTRVAGIDRASWDALPIDVRAETVRALYRVVVLSATWRGPGFDPASVRMKRVTS